MSDGVKQKMSVGSKKIHIKPGMGPETVMTFTGEGHQRPMQHNSDLIVMFKQVPHEHFKRFQDNLILMHKISLLDAMKAGPIFFKTIENDQIEISIDSVIGPDSFRVIPGKGMPILNNDPLSPLKRDYGKGDLIVKFDIQFPKNLDETKKNELSAVLDEI
jgi:DnaJ-class molecular chaperone